MKKKCLPFFYFIFIITIPICSQNIVELEPELIRSFSFGRGEQQIGVGVASYGLQGSYSESIGKNYIVLNDTTNNRFIIFDLDYNIIDHIEYKGFSSYHFSVMSMYKITENGNIIGFEPIKKQLVKISLKEKIILFAIPENNIPFNIKNLWYYNVWLFGEYFLFYRSDGNPGIINEHGRLLNNEETKKLLDNLKEKNCVRSRQELKDKIDEFLAGNKLIMIYNTILTINLRKFKEYLKTISKYSDDYNEIVKIKSGVVEAQLYYGEYYIYNRINNGDSYSIVVNKYGEIIKRFKADFDSISYYGDLYGSNFNCEKGQYEFYRIKRTWGEDLTNFKVSEIDIGSSAKNSTLSTITTSSILTEKTDKNMYHPIKVLDNKPATGWIESVKGNGIGQWLEMSFEKPVTADKLIVSPGWFDKQYWAESNRIKKMRIEVNGEKVKAFFQDTMNKQPVALEKKMTFSKIRFVVEDVYSTTKWDDTCISEIEFYFGNTKLDIDISRFKDKLKVVPE